MVDRCVAFEHFEQRFNALSANLVTYSIHTLQQQLRLSATKNSLQDARRAISLLCYTHSHPYSRVHLWEYASFCLSSKIIFSCVLVSMKSTENANALDKQNRVC
eukprot:2567336-Pleurochrysis_carterae.AAC.1